ncbi:MAG: MATE family efflux transporter [Oscillospiraceae bacterium]|nr:MATE family efflux transporter [Oscillospiraceae bacterium]
MIQLSDHFDYKRLLKFTLPSIASMIIGSVYSIVDGFFVSNFVGKTEFTALNLIFPFLMILGAVGNMIGVGGTALVAKTLGEGDKEKANDMFSFFIYVCTLSGVLFSVFGTIFLPQISVMLGATEELLPHCIDYGKIMLIGLPLMMLQYTFQGFLIAAEKPQISMYITVAAGLTNVVLDALFVGVLGWGLGGAAAATAISQSVGGLLPAFLFARRNTGWSLHLGRCVVDFRALGQACSNGASSFLSSISSSVVGILFNFQLLKYAGPDGVAAYGVIMYVEMIFLAASFGYTSGISPVISYHYGAENHDELKNLVKRSIVIVAVSSVLMFAMAQLLARPVTMIFTSYDQALTDMTTHAFRLYAFNFIVSGMGVWGSTLFAALNNGKVASVLSFLRLVVYQAGFVMILPALFGIGGIWITMAVANRCSAVTAVVFMALYREKYHY